MTELEKQLYDNPIEFLFVTLSSSNLKRPIVIGLVDEYYDVMDARGVWYCLEAYYDGAVMRAILAKTYLHELVTERMLQDGDHIKYVLKSITTGSDCTMRMLPPKLTPEQKYAHLSNFVSTTWIIGCSCNTYRNCPVLIQPHRQRALITMTNKKPNER